MLIAEKYRIGRGDDMPKDKDVANSIKAFKECGGYFHNKVVHTTALAALRFAKYMIRGEKEDGFFYS